MRNTLCLQCGSVIASKYSKKFCNRSCSATFNNTGRRRWFKNHNFCKCGKHKSHKHNTECLDCKLQTFGEKTLGEVLYKGKVFHARIRTHARAVIKKAAIVRNCKFCKDGEFEKILEVCHIKAVSDFELNTKIKEINNISNLIYLCPNHHTMLDRGLIQLDLK